MKTKIEIEIDSVFAPSLYALLNKELEAANELAHDEKFAKVYPNLTELAHLTVRNLTPILNKLREEF